jgi:hypothetical protein
MLGTSCVAEQMLVSQEGLASMKLVFYLFLSKNKNFTLKKSGASSEHISASLWATMG